MKIRFFGMRRKTNCRNLSRFSGSLLNSPFCRDHEYIEQCLFWNSFTAFCGPFKLRDSCVADWAEDPLFRQAGFLTTPNYSGELETVSQ